MTDRTDTLLYGENVLIKLVYIENAIKDIAKIRGFSKDDISLFTFTALLAAALASEIKDDNGSVYCIQKDRNGNSYTAICETDGRLRGYKDSDVSIPGDRAVILTVGRRLELRGDYKSTVEGSSPLEAAKAYFERSRQTKTMLKLPENSNNTVIIAEYLPGHDVNTVSESEAETKDKKELLTEAAEACEKLLSGVSSPHISRLSSLPILFGCTCNKRRVRKILEDAGQGVADGTEVVCRFCGKKYTF